ncbi:MAG: hypothetical protein RR837_09620 [Bacteroidales bacterium]
MKKTLSFVLSGLMVGYMVAAPNNKDEHVRRKELPVKTLDRIQQGRREAQLLRSTEIV